MLILYILLKDFHSLNENVVWLLFTFSGLLYKTKHLMSVFSEHIDHLQLTLKWEWHTEDNLKRTSIVTRGNNEFQLHVFIRYISCLGSIRVCPVLFSFELNVSLDLVLGNICLWGRVTHRAAERGPRGALCPCMPPSSSTRQFLDLNSCYKHEHAWSAWIYS